ncbi:hypothetical protein HOP51_08545 [Halomonas sp. MCCC 1A11036]|uniref:Uncharacterized protein n=1 Tax=Billgrantia zhangzhouensis TaxID=2733481 RepID=A0ABS9AEJ0_9GAMM|nr:hypothetical protein [Halomonas zhangzhouensis]MCE8020162.1 hypothetical protein [Halomonas zhangzhouensis]
MVPAIARMAPESIGIVQRDQEHSEKQKAAVVSGFFDIRVAEGETANLGLIHGVPPLVMK